MTISELIEKLGELAEKHEILIAVNGYEIFLHRKQFPQGLMNKINYQLNKYGELQYWILHSDTLEKGVMYQIEIFR